MSERFVPLLARDGRRDGRTVRLTAESVGVYTGLALLGIRPARRPPFLGSSTVEQAAVNRKVTGSNPVRGALTRKSPRSQVRLSPGFFVPQRPAPPPFFRSKMPRNLVR